MKTTRRVLIAANAQLNAQLAACGPDATLSRKQLRVRLAAARKEVEMLTAQNLTQTAQIDSLTQQIAASKKAAQPA